MHEPYVTDPAEPAPRPALAGLRPMIATLVVLLLIVAGMTLYWVGRGEEDPALQVPAGQSGEQGAPDG